MKRRRLMLVCLAFIPNNNIKNIMLSLTELFCMNKVMTHIFAIIPCLTWETTRKNKTRQDMSWNTKAKS